MIRQHPRFQKTRDHLISAIHLTDLDRLKGYEGRAVDYISGAGHRRDMRAKVGVFGRSLPQDATIGASEPRTGTAGERAYRDLAATTARLQTGGQPERSVPGDAGA